MTTQLTHPLLGFVGAPEGGILFVLYVIVSILATVKVIRMTSGSAIPLWLLFIWIVPCIGGIAALVAVRKPAP